MQISLSKFLGVLMGIVGVLLFLGFGYFCYLLFFDGPVPSPTPSLQSINVGILGPKMQKAAKVLVNASDKIALSKNDISFTESALFKSFKEIPDNVPMSDSRGRADPFVPYYAAP